MVQLNAACGITESSTVHRFIACNYKISFVAVITFLLQVFAAAESGKWCLMLQTTLTINTKG